MTKDTLIQHISIEYDKDIYTYVCYDMYVNIYIYCIYDVQKNSVIYLQYQRQNVLNLLYQNMTLIVTKVNYVD